MADPILINVTGVLRTDEDTPDPGAVITFTRPVAIQHLDGTRIEPGDKSATAGVNGAITLDLISTTDPAWTPVGWSYGVKIQPTDRNRIERFTAQIPHDASGGNLTLGEILIEGDPSDGELYAAANHTHADLVTDADLGLALDGLPDIYVTDAELTAADFVSYTTLQEELLVWDTNHPPFTSGMRSGSRYAPVHGGFAASTVALNEMRYVPIDVRSAVTVSEIAAEVTTIASAGGVARLIIARSGTNGRPEGNLVYVSGQLATTGLGKISVSGLSVVLTAGRYFFVCLPQVALASFRSINNVPAMYEQPTLPTFARCCYSQYTVTGAPTVVGTLALDAGDAPRVEVLIA